MINGLIRFFTFAEYPKQIKYMMWNEGAERYAFYGMRAILVIYMFHYLNIEQHLAAATYNYFEAFCYFSPLIGAYLADRYIGKFKVIISFSTIYMVGFLILALVPTTAGLFTALFFIALGVGGIKPCVAAFMADQLDTNAPDYKQTRAKAFSMFYFMVNFGSIFSTVLTPITREYFGPRIAFSIPAVLMFISIIIILMGRKYYIHKEATKSEVSLFKIIGAAIRNRSKKLANSHFLSGAEQECSKENVTNAYNLFQIVKIFLFLIIFYSVWDQQGSSWVIQATKMNLNFLGIHLQPDLMQFLNPILIMVCIPLFNRIIYPFVDKNLFKVTPFRKIGTGIILSGIAFITLGIYQNFIDQGVSVNIMWQAITYVIITVSEVLVVITALEFSYAQAPESMKSILISIFWLTVFFGNLLAGFMSQINVFTGGTFFYFFAGLAIIMGLLFIPIAKTYNHIENK
ncbi:MFS transporter [Rickettsiales bacterium LUAb2]